MADKQIHQLKALYGEIHGIANNLPLTSGVVDRSVVELYNHAITELNQFSDSDYSRFKATRDDLIRNNMYRQDSLKAKMGGLLARLEQEFGFRDPAHSVAQPLTNIVTIHNNNQMHVTVIPIQTILQNVQDEDLRADIEDLKEVVEGSKDKQKASSILNTIQQKSWDVFIALLPAVLQGLGQAPSQ